LPKQDSAAPDNVLDDILALGAGSDTEEILGESETSDSEEIAEPEQDDGEEGTQDPDESDEQPEDEEASEEDVEETKEEGTEPEEEPTDRGDSRIRALAQQAKRAQKFGSVLDMLEEDPNLARELVARKLGLVPADQAVKSQPQQPVQPERQAPSKEQLQKYWTERFQTDFAGALSEFMDLKLQGVRAESRQLAEPTAVASFNSEVRSYKADLKVNDEQFEYYEPYFDALLKSADRNYVMQAPDTTLAALRDLAYGKWANEQRSRRAKALKQGQPARRDNPRNSRLASSQGSRTGGPVKRTRQLTKEEEMLADRYGVDLVTEDEDEPESAWR